MGTSGKVGNNSLIFSASQMTYDGFRENSAASSAIINLISTQNFNNQIILKAILNYNYSPYLLNPSSLNKTDAENNPQMVREFVKQQGSGKKNNQFQGGVTFSYLLNPFQKFEATIYGISRSTLNPIPGRYIKLNRFSGGFRTNYSNEFSIHGVDFSLLTGADFEFQNDLRKEYDNLGLNNYKSIAASEIIKNVQTGNILLNQEEKVLGYGIFSKLEFFPLNNFSISAGVRYDNFNFKVDDNLKSGGIDYSGNFPMDNFNQIVGIVYKINTSNQAFANYSTSFQTPTTSELSNTPAG